MSEDIDALLASLADMGGSRPVSIQYSAPPPQKRESVYAEDRLSFAPRMVQPSPAPTYSSPSQHHYEAAPIQHTPHVAQYSAQPTRVTSPPASRGGARPTTLQGRELDNILSDLSSAPPMRGSPGSQGSCYTCGRPVLGESIQAMGRTFHPEHFVCHNCHDPMGTANFHEKDGAAHCERCYLDLFCSRCAHCDQAIADKCVTALGRKWHVHHFICTTCSKPFHNGSFFERDGRPYCEAHFHEEFTPRCAGCNQNIRGEIVNALGATWHPEHFSCQTCQKTFTGSTFYEIGGKPYCETHFHTQNGNLCAGCGKAISGKAVSAFGKKFHPEHFVCGFCMNPLPGGAFTEKDGKPYCRDCHGKLFKM
eukprot:TRINITY_DN10597_c0_g1_i2.p1 TRINITY_DN10597_c0_g1~~TRINITY_DN10597_c0_g1_i2.p1  ORF type:complete len:386 (+),score=56.47 TRINITY_DN10597_c0_g1_i2:68-1159(+)